MLLRWIFLCLTCLSLCSRAEEKAGPVLTCAAVRQLSPEQLEERRPVLLEGVVTHFADDVTRDFWLQDGTAGIYVIPSAGEPAVPHIPPGTRVRVRGTTSARTFAPGVVAQAVEVLGPGVLPPPVPVSLDELIAGNREGEYVELTAVIRSVRGAVAQGVPQWDIRLARDRGRLTVVVPAVPGEPQPDYLVDAKVKVRGVMNAFHDQSSQTFFRLLRLTSAEDIRVEEAAPADPFTQPVVSLYELSRFVPRGLTQHRVRVRGTVTLCRPEERCFLEEAGYGLQIIDAGVPDWRPGEVVEVVGFPAVGDTRLFLENALFRKVPGESPPVPHVVATKELANSYLPNRLIRTTAQLTGILRNPGSISLLLREGNVLVRAEVPLPETTELPEEWNPGSRMTVTGIWVEQGGDGGRTLPETASQPVQHLLMRELSDVALTTPAPWWTERRLQTLALATAVALAAVFGWAALLRRQVRRRTDQLSAEIRARLGERAAFDAVRTERQRLAADLHDGIEQLIATAAWQVESAAGCPDIPTAVPRLHLARRLLGRCREEMRRSVWDLRAESLERGDLLTAIREAVRPLASHYGIPVEVEGEGTLPALPPHHAGCLLRLTQEAVSNALRHAAPGKVTVTLHGEPDRLILTIADDGRGFDTATPPGVDDGHYGLTGMSERAVRIGARLDIQSEPGHGTTIRVDSPLGPPAPASPSS